MTTAPPLIPARTSRAGLLSNGWLLLALYFGAQWLSRILVSPALELDEAEQALWTQSLQWGYGAQPPLYTWLQWGVFQLFGVSVSSLALLKNLLLASTYVCVFVAGRLLMPTPLAALAAASMLLLPQIGWESSRDLTHSVLMTTLAAATLALVVALLERPRPVLYLLLGVTVGLGFLSKYSYALFLLALLVAVLLGRDTRAVLASRWAVVAVLLALLIVTPHGLWLLEHWQMATETTRAKMDLAPAPGQHRGPVQGLLSLVSAIAGFVWPWALAMALLFGRSLRSAWNPRAMAAGRSWNPAGLWRRYLIVLAVVFVAMVLLGDVTRFKDRWMQPLLFCLPLIAFSCWPGLAQHARLPRLRRVLIAVALLVLLLLTLRPNFHAWRARPNDLNQPVLALAQALQAAGYNGQGRIQTSDRTLAGNLRLRFPAAQVEVRDTGPGALPDDRPLLRIDKLSGTTDKSPPPVSDTVQGTTLALPYLHAAPTLAPAQFRYQLLR